MNDDDDILVVAPPLCFLLILLIFTVALTDDWFGNIVTPGRFDFEDLIFQMKIDALNVISSFCKQHCTIDCDDLAAVR